MSKLWLWNVQQLLMRNHVWMNAPGSHYEAAEIRLGQGGWGGLEVSTRRRKQLVGCGELSSMQGEATQSNGDTKQQVIHRCHELVAPSFKDESKQRVWRRMVQDPKHIIR
jgi:hypothetical protein